MEHMITKPAVRHIAGARIADANAAGAVVRSSARGSVRRRSRAASSWIRVAVTSLLLMLAFMAGVMLPHPAQSVADPQLVTSYTVQPGDTLWSYAESITPDGGDVRDTVSRLVRLNHLDDDALETGQRILVPVE